MLCIINQKKVIMSNAQSKPVVDSDLVYDFDTTIVTNIKCKKCNNILPPMTMAMHLHGDFVQECPHKHEVFGYESSDCNNRLIRYPGEPILCFNVAAGCDFITTFSHLKSQNYKLVDGELWNEEIPSWAARSHDRKQHPLNWYDIWNYDLIVGYGTDDDMIEKVKAWVDERVKNDKPKSESC